MPIPAHPAILRTTCVYDPAGRQVLVATPTGQRCTFPYDRAAENSAKIAVTADRVAWTPEPVRSLADPSSAPIDGAFGTWKYDSSTIRKLVDLGSGRTTYMFNSLPDPLQNGCPSARVTFVFEPVSAEVIALLLIPLSPEQDAYLAYRKVDRLQKLGKSEAASQAIGEFILHPVIEHMLEKACPINGSGDDVRQGAIERLLDCRISDGLSFEDRGPYRFAAWIWTVCSRACFHSLRVELRWKRSKIILKDGLLSEIARSRGDRSIAEQLLHAVDQLQDPEVRAILLEIIFGVTIADAASARKVSVGEMHKLRERAKAVFRESDPDLPGLP